MIDRLGAAPATLLRSRGGRSTPSVLLAGAVALMTTSGCAAVAQAGRRTPGTLANGTFTVARPGAIQYAPNAELTCPGGGTVPLLDHDLAAAARSAHKPVPQLDGRLCAAAETLLGWTEPQSPPESVVRFVAAHFGVPVPIRRVLTTTVETEDPRAIADRLGELAAKLTLSGTVPRYGVATQRVRKDVTRIVMLLQDASVELQPVLRTVPVNGVVTVAGRLLGDYENARIRASTPVGKLEAVDATGKQFEARFSCGDRPGRMQVEIRADRNGDAATLASFPVGCGEPFASSVAVPPAAAAGVDAAREARRFFDLTNADRKAIGVAPLAWDDAVAGVAGSAADYLRVASSGGSATPFDLKARLAQADVASPLILQNPVAATSAEEAHAVLMTNPVDRSNVLNPEVTHAGVGAVAAPLKDSGLQVVYFSELLVKELPPLDAADVARKVRAAIARKRSEARATPLADDALLDEVAQKYAAALARGRGAITKEQGDAIVAPLYKAFRTVNFISGVKVDPVEFADEPGVAGPAKQLGVGVASGVSAALGKNSAFVVVIAGTRR